MEMGVFEALPMDGTPVTATAISEKLGVDKDLLGELPIAMFHSRIPARHLSNCDTFISSIYEKLYHCWTVCRNWTRRICSHTIFANILGSRD
jgi:hypothetical protein